VPFHVVSCFFYFVNFAADTKSRTVLDQKRWVFGIQKPFEPVEFQEVVGLKKNKEKHEKHISFQIGRLENP